MRAVVVTQSGGPEVLELRDVSALEPGPDQLLVEVAVAGVNFRDIYERRGGYGAAPPVVAGVEGTGVVAAAGEGVDGFSPGDRVGWCAAQGSYADRVVVDARSAVLVPKEVSDERAAAALMQGMTAHYLAHAAYPVARGDTVLVHAAAGGVGLLLTQMATRRGGRVIATASSAEKVELARAAGAAEVIGYEDVRTRARELTAGEGVAAVYDGVGQATFEDGLASLRPRGTFVLYGTASGAVPLFDLRRLGSSGSLFVTRPTLAHYTATRSELLLRSGEVLNWIAEGTLDMRIGARYPLEQARRAQEDLESRRTTGKLLLLTG